MRGRARLVTLALLSLVALPSVADAQRSRRWDPTKDSGAVSEALKELLETAPPCTVQVLCDGRTRAVGTVVDADGWLVTKHSELQGSLACRLRDGRKVDARVVAWDERHDVALLKVDAKELSPVRWAVQEDAAVGSLVVTQDGGGRPGGFGVVGVETREIQHSGALLGVLLEDGTLGPVVREVTPDSGADEADIQPGDVILEVAGTEVLGRDALIRYLRRQRPGVQLEVKLKRGDQRLTVTPRFGSRDESNEGNLAGPVSRVASGFPAAFQHDTLLRPEQCGSPVLDLHGRVIGFNIARSGRTETYAIPAKVMAELVTRLRKQAESTADAESY